MIEMTEKGLPMPPSIARQATPRVIAVSATPLFRLGVSAAFAEERGAELVATAETEIALFDLLAAVDVDVVLIDGDLPGIDPVDLGTIIRQTHPVCGTVLLAKANDELLLRALAGGLSAFVPTSASARVLVATVRHAALAPTSFTAPELAAALSRRDRGRAILSPRELEVVRFLHAGLTIAEIAGRMTVTESTVKTYVARLYDKLGVRNRAEALLATRDLLA